MWPTKLGLFLLRVYTGAVFVDAIYYKLWVTRMHGLGMSLFEALDDFVATDYRRQVNDCIDDPPVVFGTRWQWYADFLESAMLPGAVPDVMGPAILAFELLLGISLIFGVGVRLMAFLGAVLMAVFGLAKNLYFFTVTGTNWMLVFVLLFFALSGAGRIWGFDQRLRAKWPAWVS